MTDRSLLDRDAIVRSALLALLIRVTPTTNFRGTAATVLGLSDISFDPAAAQWTGIGLIAVFLLVALIYIAWAWSKFDSERRAAENASSGTLGFQIHGIKQSAEIAARGGNPIGDATGLLTSAEAELDQFLNVPRFLSGAFIYGGLGFALVGLTIAVHNLHMPPHLTDEKEVDTWSNGVQMLLKGFQTAFLPAIAGILATLVSSFCLSLSETRLDKAMKAVTTATYRYVLPEARKLVPPQYGDLSQIVPVMGLLLKALDDVSERLVHYPSQLDFIQARHETALTSLTQTIESLDTRFGSHVAAISASLGETSESLVKLGQTSAAAQEGVATELVSLKEAVVEMKGSLAPFRSAAAGHAAIINALRSVLDQSKEDSDRVRDDLANLQLRITDNMLNLSAQLERVIHEFVGRVGSIGSLLVQSEAEMSQKLSDRLELAGRDLKSLTDELTSFIESERHFQAELQTLYFDMPGWVVERIGQDLEKVTEKRLAALEIAVKPLAQVSPGAKSSRKDDDMDQLFNMIREVQRNLETIRSAPIPSIPTYPGESFSGWPRQGAATAKRSLLQTFMSWFKRR